MAELPEGIQRVAAWAKKNPALAAGAIGGVALVAYLVSRNLGQKGGTAASDESGLAGGGLGDSVVTVPQGGETVPAPLPLPLPPAYPTGYETFMQVPVSEPQYSVPGGAPLEYALSEKIYTPRSVPGGHPVSYFQSEKLGATRRLSSTSSSARSPVRRTKTSAGYKRPNELWAPWQRRSAALRRQSYIRRYGSLRFLSRDARPGGIGH